MSIVSLEAKDEKNISMSIAQFFAVYGIISLLRNCGGLKLKGVPVRELFTYTVTNAFHLHSDECFPHGQLLYAAEGWNDSGGIF